ncbi:hypothetical protein [Paenibacillus prosopidis]|uniref:Uncharacterized protein n=1 Tax=Paenibacillus prosopidis TaxID=630520 RepID=A0A368VRH8_9BACL|nr:hypothetical protein [Paenibacillus prosopidis]RCW44253.1 hypothetical protein DFP97_112117 [Paenibacillus prosopidis]
METYMSYVVKHKDGYMVNVHFKSVESIKFALRFNHVEDFKNFMIGHYKPENPEDYYLQPIKTTYEEVESDG